ncbi:Threonine aldolase [Coemansia sp. RSA 1813]|nr:Threonine aldolase [Coemansia sp. RSA 1843]KAJ2216004.1 Threonine aldolase [Coemansia sp. RSA 487]KAJ2570417.1 Threonine aldolase [Coemansia sp. RSA 1813]
MELIKESRNWDLRSDTVTKPTAEMLSRMMEAQVGDDVFGEDITVKGLEQTVAKLCNKQAALFCVSSTMSNQLAIRTHITTAPASLIVHRNSHIFQYESGGASLLTQAMMVPVLPGSTINLTKADVEKSVIPDNFLYHKAPTKLVCLENTFSGVVMPLEDIEQIAEMSHGREIPVHMDGSRLWNASVATGISLATYANHVNSLNLCLSKGMGCPVGAMLVGSSEFIDRARHFRKVFGGGWRQAGVLAAAGLYSIEKIWPTMEESHRLARKLADGFVEMGFILALPVDTNMVILSKGKQFSDQDFTKLAGELKPKGIVLGLPYEGSVRIVVHHQITDDCIDSILQSARSLSSV